MSGAVLGLWSQVQLSRQGISRRTAVGWVAQGLPGGGGPVGWGRPWGAGGSGWASLMGGRQGQRSRRGEVSGLKALVRDRRASQPRALGSQPPALSQPERPEPGGLPWGWPGRCPWGPDVACLRPPSQQGEVSVVPPRASTLRAPSGPRCAQPSEGARVPSLSWKPVDGSPREWASSSCEGCRAQAVPGSRAERAGAGLWVLSPWPWLKAGCF